MGVLQDEICLPAGERLRGSKPQPWIVTSSLSLNFLIYKIGLTKPTYLRTGVMKRKYGTPFKVLPEPGSQVSPALPAPPPQGALPDQLCPAFAATQSLAPLYLAFLGITLIDWQSSS